MAEWWRSAVFYEIYLRSFADSDGDGLGDLTGIRAHLPYVRELGIDGIRVTPFYPSPGRDHGYDVSDYVAVDPVFGTLAAFDALVSDAHDLDLYYLHFFSSGQPDSTGTTRPFRPTSSASSGSSSTAAWTASASTSPTPDSRHVISMTSKSPNRGRPSPTA